jgi:hypothetical protein
MSDRSYWWVNQKTYEIQRDGAFLWSPKVEKNGSSNPGFSNMLLANVGDLFFVNHKSTIVAVGIVKAKAIESNRPLEFPITQNPLSLIGWRIDADYFEIPKSLRVSISELVDIFVTTPATKSPFASNSRAKQKLYLNELRLEDGEKVLKAIRIKSDILLNLDSAQPTSHDKSTSNNNKKPHIARLTWNENVWSKPSGPKKKHESEDNFTAQYGYGHEEWLFSNKFIFENYSYGFIEGAYRKKESDHGRSFDVMLYTISKAQGWYFVGEIDDCEILDQEEADRALKFFLEGGLIDDMVKDVETVGGNPTFISSQVNGSRSLFNVRFKSSDLKIYAKPLVIPKDSELRKYNRYHVNEIYDEDLLDELDSFEPEKLKVTIGSRSIPAKEIILSYKHNEMQNELLSIFKKKYKDVRSEFRNIDLFISDKKDYLIEIKTYESPKACIREAIGQLLEYSYYHEDYNDPHLIIIGPSRLLSDDYTYINKLNGLMDVHLDYFHYVAGSNEFEHLFITKDKTKRKKGRI